MNRFRDVPFRPKESVNLLTRTRFNEPKVMDAEVLRSNTVVAHSPPWQQSESIALLTAVLAYCRSQTPSLDARSFQTNQMIHVLPRIVWPINSVVRTVNDCIRRFIRIRSAWRVCIITPPIGTFKSVSLSLQYN
jgi:hypothetical protein